MQSNGVPSNTAGELASGSVNTKLSLTQSFRSNQVAATRRLQLRATSSARVSRFWSIHRPCHVYPETMFACQTGI